MDHAQSALATIKVGSQYMLTYLILGSVTTFTSASSSLRYMAIFVIIGLAISIHSAVYQNNYISIPLRGILAMGAWIQVFNSYDILVHSRINYAEHREWKRGKALIANGGTIWFTLSIPNNFRRLDTKWQRIPNYSFGGSPGEVRRGKFVQDKFQSLFFRGCTAVYVFLACYYLDWIPKQEEILQLLGQSSLRLDLSWEFLPALIHLHFFFVITTYLLLNAIYELLSIAAVCLHFSSPSHWPPFYGSALEARSVRRFWGKFWHQTFRSFLTSNAEFIISVTPIRPNTITSRYARYFLCFFISGLIHLSLDLAIGISLDNSGATIFFTAQPIAFAVEDMAKHLSNKYGIMANDTASKRIMGYIWVFAFSFWSWRPWAYPILMKSLEVGEPITSTYFKTRGFYINL